ncbi:MAG: lnt, partial [Pseudonocardia sp.]|nr:lnt [Pseudonocardia sp.]
VLGVEHRSGAHLYNTALTFPRDGSAPLVYHKRYPVPGVEDAVTPGGAPGFLPGDGRGGVAICADMGQVSLGREYGRAGVGLMAVPALDFDVDAWAQSRVQLLRGVENGFSVARAARQGYLTLSDGNGRVLAQAASTAGIRAASVTADLPSAGGGTPYSRAGDWFAWLCLALCAAARAHGGSDPTSTDRAPKPRAPPVRGSGQPATAAVSRTARPHADPASMICTSSNAAAFTCVLLGPSARTSATPSGRQPVRSVQLLAAVHAP